MKSSKINIFFLAVTSCRSFSWREICGSKSITNPSGAAVGAAKSGSFMVGSVTTSSGLLSKFWKTHVEPINKEVLPIKRIF